MGKRAFRRQGLNLGRKRLGYHKDLRSQHWSARTTNDKKFEYSRLESKFFLHYLSEESETERLHFVSLGQAIIYLKIVPGQVLDPADLPRTQAFRICETIKIVVITEHEKFMLATF